MWFELNKDWFKNFLVKYIIILFIFFMQIYKVNSLEFACQFEEVYSEGQVQQGSFLIKNENLRYEYFDQNLFTIIHKNGQTTISKNTDRKYINEYDENNNLINHLITITDDYPFFKDVYLINEYKIILEKSKNSDFIKRLAIVSNQLNLSIFFQNCRNKEILDLYFQHYPYFKFKFL